MAIFGNKKKSLTERFEELFAELDNLPDEEQDKFWAAIEEKVDEAMGEDDEPNEDGAQAPKDESGKPDTEEEIAKAKEDIAEKGENSQTEKDRVDESVAAQEEEHGQEDSQDAKDRVDEAEGEEKAEKHKEWEERFAAIEARLSALEGNEEGEDKEALEKAKAVYGVDGGTFAPDKNPKRATIEQAKKFAAKYL